MIVVRYVLYRLSSTVYFNRAYGQIILLMSYGLAAVSSLIKSVSSFL